MPANDSRRVLNAAYREARRWGVVDELARLHAWATLAMYYFDGISERGRPDIISGYRSPEKQRRLLQRWRRGDREGLAFKPATSSWHMAGRALDVETTDHLRRYAAYMEYLGAEWGGRFGDPNHFALPSFRGPPSIA